MANVTIPNLTSATTITPSTVLLVIEQTAGTRKATPSQLFTDSATQNSGLGITSGGVYTIKTGLDSNISDINTLLGDTSIASIGDGTVTGAINEVNSNLTPLKVNDVITPLTGVTLSRSGNVRILHFDNVFISNGQDISTWLDMLPKATTEAIMCVPASNPVRVELRQNGIVSVWNTNLASTTNASVYGTLVYTV